MQEPTGHTTAAYGAPAHLVRCSCGFARTVNDDAHADAVLEEHETAHQALAAVSA